MRVCDKDDCERRHYGRGLCRVHYETDIRRRAVRELIRGPKPDVIEHGDTSWCPGCKQHLPVEQFHKNARRKPSGLSVWCKKCKSGSGKEQYRNKVSDPGAAQMFRDRGKKKRAALRLEALAAYGGRCACCGEDWDAYLEIDHIDGGGSEHRSSVGGVWQDLKRRGYPPGIQVLCANCHAAKTRGFPCRHLGDTT